MSFWILPASRARATITKHGGQPLMLGFLVKGFQQGLALSFRAVPCVHLGHGRTREAVAYRMVVRLGERRLVTPAKVTAF